MTTNMKERDFINKLTRNVKKSLDCTLQTSTSFTCCNGPIIACFYQQYLHKGLMLLKTTWAKLLNAELLSVSIIKAPEIP